MYTFFFSFSETPRYADVHFWVPFFLTVICATNVVFFIGYIAYKQRKPKEEHKTLNPMESATNYKYTTELHAQ